MAKRLPGPAARRWIAAQLTEAGRQYAGEIGEPRVRPWSIVVQVATDDGSVWFKANRAQTTYEPALLGVLVQRVPGMVLTPLAIDVDRGWSLLPDGGPILRSFPDDTVLRHWERVLPAYAQLQRDLAAHLEDLTTAGVPDERPARLPELFALLLDQTDVLLVGEPDGLSPVELDQLRSVGPALTASCKVLADSAIPSTVDHGDLHDGNVFVTAAGPAVFDWGDACVTHPFASLLVTMSALRARFDLAPDAPALARLRDAYLEPWTAFHNRSELAELASLAVAIAPLNRALSWGRALSAVPPAYQREYRDAVPGWLRDLLPAAQAARG
jgi:Phosphotransferase enzyme family